MKLITAELRDKLLANGKLSQHNENFDPQPVVKLFTPDGSGTWLLSELDPNDPDLAFGLCDLGMGEPELGYVRISDLESVRGHLGLPIERDIHWSPDHTISEYASIAQINGTIAA